MGKETKSLDYTIKVIIKSEPVSLDIPIHSLTETKVSTGFQKKSTVEIFSNSKCEFRNENFPSIYVDIFNTS